MSNLTRIVKGEDLEGGQTLIGEAGGRSEIYEVSDSISIEGALKVETEHGILFFDPDSEYLILADE